MDITPINITRHEQRITAHERIIARYVTLNTCVLPYLHLFVLIYLYYMYIPLPQVVSYKIGKRNSSLLTQPSRNVFVFCTYMSVDPSVLNIYNLYSHLVAATHHTIPPTNE